MRDDAVVSLARVEVGLEPRSEAVLDVPRGASRPVIAWHWQRCSVRSPYRVPLTTADQVNAARSTGRRVITVGTTVARALETVADEAGRVHPGAGWTELVITP